MRIDRVGGVCTGFLVGSCNAVPQEFVVLRLVKCVKRGDKVSSVERSAVIKQDGCHFLSLNEIDVKTGVNTHILTFTARYG